MSWRASAWCLDQVKGVGANAKLVLLALCEFANDENVTWRSQEEIAVRSECEVRTVKKHLKALEGWGLISRKGIYRWCDSDSEVCMARSPHKHRSGTVYRVHLEIGDFVAPDHVVVPDSDSVSVGSVDKSIGANIALVEKTASESQKVHRCNICTCEGGDGSTGANLGIPQVQERAPICNSKPPRISSNHSREALACGKSDSSGVAWHGGIGSEDQVLLQECIPPDYLSVLGESAAKVCLEVLRVGIGQGWEPSQIRLKLAAQPLPVDLANGGGLVIYRVRDALAVKPVPVSGRRERSPGEVFDLVNSILEGRSSLPWQKQCLVVNGFLNNFPRADAGLVSRADRWLSKQLSSDSANSDSLDGKVLL
ncbi:helix-turn-helix domain-containing protein [Arcanobacterium hippocoleae]|uniref:Helix-turn-helix domain-containing protein n=1 Tax=Arcanobacterium hippocoleae TaxID=149017 RepID=A0ABU1T1I7_9ACTO|nr:helix-turn-helix domain-containing protein [Arcanobacterium hippocoleae]MDR6939249.1 hypothetical protein [Arcanobacterium hippocoleae]